MKKKKKKKTTFDPDAFGDVDSAKESKAADSTPADDTFSEEKTAAQGS